MRDTLDNPVRLKALAEQELMDTETEDSFDRLTRLSQRLLKTPTTFISLVDDHRQFFKSSVGLPKDIAEKRETPLTHSICKHVVQSGEPLFIPDTRIDHLFKDTPAVREIGVVSYLGFPLKSPEGHTFGAFCAIDTKPRNWSTADIEIMRELAELTISEISLRQSRKKEREASRRLSKIASQVRGIICQYRRSADGTLSFPYVSEGIRELYGVTPEEAMADASRVFSVIHPDDLPEVRRASQESARTLSPWHSQYRVRHPDGRELWVEGNSVPEREPDGSILWHGFLADITHVKRLTEQLKMIGDNIPGTAVFQWAQSPDGTLRFHYVSASIQALTGLAPKQVMDDGESFFRRLHPVDRESLVGALSLAASRNEPLIQDVRMSREAGQNRWIKVRATPRPKPGGGSFWEGSLTDITARKEDLNQLYRTHRALSVLSRSNETLMRAASEDELLREICEGIVSESSYVFAWVGSALDDEAKTIKPVSHAGAEQGYLATLHLSWDDSETGRGPAGTAIRSKRPVICRDAQTDPNYSLWRKEATARGFRSSIGIPLVIDGKAQGILSIYADLPDAFDAEEEQLLVRLANNLAYGLRALRSERERNEAQHSLRQTADRLALALRVSGLGLWRRNLTSGTWSMEPRALQILGLDPSVHSPSDADILERVCAEDREQVKRSWLAAQPERGPSSLRFRITHPDGQLRHLELHSQSDDPGSLPRWSLGVLNDVTDIVTTTSEAVKLRGQLAQSQKMETLGTLAAGVAHDFNNLLTGINGLMELASVSIPEKHEAANLLKEAHAGATNARVLVKKILDFARRKDGEPRVPTDINSVATDLSPLLCAALPKNASLSTRLDPSPLIVTADPSQIQQLVINLCMNAGKSLKSDVGTITLSTRRKGEHAELSIEDTGCGMDKATLSRIFEPFFTTRGADQGTGLGLSIVKEVVQSHQGTITVESSLGKGTVFHVLLPLAAHGSPLADAQTSQGAHRPPIMLVDGDLAFLDLLAGTLETNGFQAAKFSDTAGAIEALRKEPAAYAALVTDLSVPEFGGYDVVREARTLSPTLPVILMTSKAMAAGELRRRNIHSIVKPFDMASITALLTEIHSANAAPGEVSKNRA